MRNLTAIGPAAVGIVALIGAIVVALAAAAPVPAAATPAIAKTTGQPCMKCHTTPPALNDYGKKYKDNLKK
jgi:hypothetical protein